MFSDYDRVVYAGHKHAHVHSTILRSHDNIIVLCLFDLVIAHYN